MSSLPDRARRITDELRRLAESVGRPPPRLVAVTKTRSEAEVREAVAAGLHDLAENRTRDLDARRQALADLPEVRWHFVGHLQTNKVASVAGKVTLIHSLDSVRLIDKLEARLATLGSPPQPVLLEVATSGEATKTGLPPEELDAAMEAMARSPHLELHGLMTMAALGADERTARGSFARLSGMLDDLSPRHPDVFKARELSMGMSADWRWAVLEGSTMVRIGTALFEEGHA